MACRMRLPLSTAASPPVSLPAGRVGEPQESAAAAIFLASDEARYIVGAVLTVDGGATLL